jgi:hypothetical protein
LSLYYRNKFQGEVTPDKILVAGRIKMKDEVQIGQRK